MPYGFERGLRSYDWPDFGQGQGTDSDWWDENYEDILGRLMGWFNAPGMKGKPYDTGQWAYGKSEEAKGAGLDWDYLSALEPLEMWRYYGDKYNTGKLKQGVPEFDYGRWLGDLVAGGGRGPGLRDPESAFAKLQPLIGHGLREQGVKSPIHQQAMRTPFSAGALTLDQMQTGLQGLQGFRGQDIGLMLKELQMQMQLEQAKAMQPPTSPFDIITGGGCVITSACTEAKGLPDDCRELETLRKLRTWMKQKLGDGKEMISQYENLAPTIVEKINAHPEAKTIWSRIYERFVKPAVNLVDQNRNAEAVEVYKQGICELATEFL